MRIAIRHVTRYRYSPAAERPAFRLKLFPTAYATQATQSWSVHVNGEPVLPLFRNGFGDEEAIWTSQSTHEDVEILAEGVVDTEDSAGVVRGLLGSARPGVFLRTTSRTESDDGIRELADASRRNAPLDTLHALMHAVRDRVDYAPSSTSTHTTAADALKQGAGVCQDHAHVFASACRYLAMPSRYVAGYMLGAGGESRETHAWAETHVPDLGWVGFDPANRQCPTDAYIRLASGFDAADAAPMRGCIGGGLCVDLSAAVQIAQESVQMQQ
jgi:transglutaminase-like putative cysteine protease